MRPLVIVLSFFLFLALAACQAPGPSSALEVQPTLGAGVRVFAGPQDGVGAAARIELRMYGLPTGKAAEPPPVVAPPDAPPCPGAVCPVPPDPLQVSAAPVPAAGSRP